MRGSRRYRRDTATDVSLLLLHDALVQIRAVAYLRRDLGAGDDEGDAPGDYHERIRLIADACENLPRLPQGRHSRNARRGDAIGLGHGQPDAAQMASCNLGSAPHRHRRCDSGAAGPPN